jgi:YcxB-like protein
MDGFDGEPAYRLRWETQRDDIREAVAWNLRHSRRLWRLRLSYGVAALLLGLGGWLMAGGGGGWRWTASAAGLVAVMALAMVATLPARLRRAAWQATTHAPKELLVFDEGLLLRREATQLRMPWSEFTGMDETPRLLLLRSGAHRPIFVFPKRGLGDPAAVPRLRDHLAARLGLRTTGAGTQTTTPNA